MLLKNRFLIILFITSLTFAQSGSFLDQWSRSHTLNALLFTGLTTACILNYDQQIDDYFLKDRNSILYKAGSGLSDAAQFYGENNGRVVYTYGGLSAIMLTAGLISGNDDHYETAWMVSKALAGSFFISTALKMTIGRERPYSGKGAHEFYALEFSKNKDRRSFPSGHSATAFAMMTVIAGLYDEWWIKYPAWLFAVAAGTQRVETHHHWTSDVLVGAALGYLTGKWVLHDHKASDQSSNAVRIQPSISYNLFSVTVHF